MDLIYVAIDMNISINKTTY